jgi:ribosomal-protein-serine acetyltransferase
VITAAGDSDVAGLLQVRQLDAVFETAECEWLVSPRLYRRDAFMETAHLVGSFAFVSVGTRRIETRGPLHDRWANAALRRLGVQEAVLRRSLRQGAEYVDQVLWSIMKEDWTKRTATPPSRWVH